ncbi:MAG: phosphopantetheine-binding protein [Candidatus Electrothrix sp. Rat3]|nr:phosphopantetheine-binding protein [Candidatus Electrothrix rattekaaiensis]
MITDAFEKELLDLICRTCKLDDIDSNTVASTDPLIGPESPLGIDSIDALEVAVTVQQEYGVRMDSKNTSRTVLQTLATLAEYIRQHDGAGVR